MEYYRQNPDLSYRIGSVEFRKTSSSKAGNQGVGGDRGKTRIRERLGLKKNQYITLRGIKGVL
jgi:hypothetical protein